MATLYRSRIDLWLLAILVLGMGLSLWAIAVVFRAGMPGEWWIAVLTAGLGIGFPAWVLLSTRYAIDTRDLLIQSGPFRWRVPLAEITKVSPTRNPLSSPALSLDRLRIEYGRGRAIMISPLEKERFQREIEERRRGRR